MSDPAVELAQGDLRLTYPDRTLTLSAERLRAGCRCAPCRAAERRGEPVQVAEGVRVLELRPVGAYALQLCFSDGHDRGIYPFVYLRELAG